MTTPADFPLDLYRGDSGRWRFKFWSGSGPYDLTGVVAKSQIRDRPGGTRIIDMLCEVTPPNIVDVALLAVDSMKLLPKGAWDLQFTYSSGDVMTLVAGAVTVTADVTDSTPG